MFETYFRENLLVITFPRKIEGAFVDIFIKSQNIFKYLQTKICKGNAQENLPLPQHPPYA